MYKKDAEIQQDVLNELKWDTHVHETDVGVSVDRGVVTLTGTVETWAKRVAAMEAAHRVRGVLDVANDIAVKLPGSPTRTDTEIAHAVRHALEWDVFVPDKQIRSTVTDGWISLEGEVEYGSQREDAENVIRNLTGVRGVTNRLELKPVVTSQELRRAIEAALERQAEGEAKRLQLEVHGGVVTLRGFVRSWAEKQAALAAAKGTHGVTRVEDQLTIAPYTA